MNKISGFYPDFIFWFKKGDNYFIVFVDPKSEEYTKAEKRIDGYEEIFMENGKEKTFSYDNMKVTVKLFLKAEGYSSEKYKQYWYDNIEKMLEGII